MPKICHRFFLIEVISFMNIDSLFTVLYVEMNITSLRFSDHQPQSIFFIQKMLFVLQTLKWNQIKLNFEMVSLCILKSYCKAHDKYTGIIKQVEIKKRKKRKKVVSMARTQSFLWMLTLENQSNLCI